MEKDLKNSLNLDADIIECKADLQLLRKKFASKKKTSTSSNGSNSAVNTPEFPKDKNIKIIEVQPAKKAIKTAASNSLDSNNISQQINSSEKSPKQSNSIKKVVNVNLDTKQSTQKTVEKSLSASKKQTINSNIPTFDLSKQSIANKRNATARTRKAPARKNAVSQQKSESGIKSVVAKGLSNSITQTQEVNPETKLAFSQSDILENAVLSNKEKELLLNPDSLKKPPAITEEIKNASISSDEEIKLEKSITQALSNIANQEKENVAETTLKEHSSTKLKADVPVTNFKSEDKLSRSDQKDCLDSPSCDLHSLNSLKTVSENNVASDGDIVECKNSDDTLLLDAKTATETGEVVAKTEKATESSSLQNTNSPQERERIDSEAANFAKQFFKEKTSDRIQTKNRRPSRFESDYLSIDMQKVISEIVTRDIDHFCGSKSKTSTRIVRYAGV